MTRPKVLSATAFAVVTLGVLVGTASANHLSVSSQTFSATWTSAEFTEGFGTVRCNLSLEGSIHTRTINKAAGLLVGAITRASVGPCATGSATVLAETLPWHVQYEAFTGALPEIGSVTFDVVGAGFQIREPIFGATFLGRSEVRPPWKTIWNVIKSVPKNIQLSGSIRTPFGTVTMSGTSSTNSAQTVSLI